VRDAVHLVVGQLAIRTEPESRSRIRAPYNGLAIDAGLATASAPKFEPKPSPASAELSPTVPQ
jgi:hypothetical protein